MIEASVIIPTHNRRPILELGLQALLRQNCDEYEIIVIDDGSRDDTWQLLERLRQQYPGRICCFRQENKGPAAARNVGIEQAAGRLLLFLGDDIIPAGSDFIQEHVRWHTNRYSGPEFGVLGYTTWHPELNITPYMIWLENGGPQFAYGRLQHDSLVDCWYFYASNISIKREFLAEYRFEERFRDAAWEDTELGYRLGRQGLRIAFNRQALAYHHHAVRLDEYCGRATKAGRGEALLMTIHPELLGASGIERNRSDMLRGAVMNALTMPFWLRVAKWFEVRWRWGRLFGEVYRYHYGKAFREALRATQGR